MLPEVALLVGGVPYSGWRDVRISRGIEQFSGSFDLTLTDKWSAMGRLPVLDSGLPCTVTVSGQPVITGYIDDVEFFHDKSQHGIRIRGRDRAGDLVDCSARTDAQSWVGRDLLQIAEDLCQPFRIVVRKERGVDIGPVFNHSHLQPGETVYEALERAIRMRGKYCVSDSLGNLVITEPGRAGLATTVLRLGHNILGGSAQQSYKDRFSSYVIQGQHRGSDGFNGKAASQAEGRTQDKEIGRHRPHYVIAEEPASSADCQHRADWEKTIRKGHSLRIRLQVKGWMDGTRVWQPNSLVLVQDDWLRLSGRYVIVQVDYRMDGQSGQLADLTLVPPDALELQPSQRTAA